VHLLGGGGVGRFEQAEHFSALVIYPILLVIDPVFPLRLQIKGMRLGELLGSNPGEFMYVDVEWHDG
jgi:hypothetical protein